MLAALPVWIGNRGCRRKSGTTEVFSIAGKLLRSFSSGAPPASSLAYSGDGRRIVMGCRPIRARQGCRDRRAARLLAGARKGHRVRGRSRDGSLIASASDDDKVRLWKAEARRSPPCPAVSSRWGSPCRPRGSGSPPEPATRRSASFPQRRVAPERARVSDGLPVSRVLARFPDTGRDCSVDGSVLLIDVVSGQARGAIGRHAQPAGTAAFSADGNRLVSASVSSNPWGAEADVKLYDLGTRRQSSTPIGRSFVNAVGFAASRAILVSAADKTIAVWEA